MAQPAPQQGLYRRDGANQQAMKSTQQGKPQFTPKQGGGFAAYSQPSMSMMAQSYAPAGGNYAYAPPDQRPPPFSQSLSFMGQQMDPSQYYGQRDAFIQNINQARQPFAMNPTPQGQQLNFGGMWNQAGDMVANGWQNPLAGLLGGGSPSPQGPAPSDGAPLPPGTRIPYGLGSSRPRDRRAGRGDGGQPFNGGLGSAATPYAAFPGLPVR